MPGPQASWNGGIRKAYWISAPKKETKALRRLKARQAVRVEGYNKSPSNVKAGFIKPGSQNPRKRV